MALRLRSGEVESSIGGEELMVEYGRRIGVEVSVLVRLCRIKYVTI